MIVLANEENFFFLNLRWGELSSLNWSNVYICGSWRKIINVVHIPTPKLFMVINQGSSVQFSHSAVSDSSWPHGPQHARPPSPSPTPGVYSNSSPLSWWWSFLYSSSVYSCHFFTSSTFVRSTPFLSAVKAYVSSYLTNICQEQSQYPVQV